MLLQAQEECLFKADTEACTKTLKQNTNVSKMKQSNHAQFKTEAGSKLVTVPE